MKIVQAEIPDFESVRRIVQTTIWSVYPRYYPSGAVVFFARHHSDESSAADIARLFVLPEHQHRGYVDAEYHTIQTGNGDFLCYDVMRKTV